eukprot:2614853-Pyramimonas_sp.AAC.1
MRRGVRQSTTRATCAHLRINVQGQQRCFLPIGSTRWSRGSRGAECRVRSTRSEQCADLHKRA